MLRIARAGSDEVPPCTKTSIDVPAQISGKTSCGKRIGRAKEHHACMDASVMAHYRTAALLTVDTQVDTLASAAFLKWVVL